MKEMIEKVIKCEEEGRQQIEQAQQQAAQIIAQAKAEGQQILQVNLEKLKIMAQQKREETGKIFLGEKEKLLAEFKQKNTVLREERQKDILAIAQKTFTQLIKIEE